jgi:hypothetical protein
VYLTGTRAARWLPRENHRGVPPKGLFTVIPDGSDIPKAFKTRYSPGKVETGLTENSTFSISTWDETDGSDDATADEDISSLEDENREDELSAADE